ncbi:MAG: 4-alpha-glucanotransferase [Pseudomonadota bacterium]
MSKSPLGISPDSSAHISGGVLDRRRAGVLLHVTSLPGPDLTGDLGPEARNFIEFLVDSGVSVWQMLPVGPTQADASPYQTRSTHAGDPRLISLEPLLAKGWLSPEERPDSPISPEAKHWAIGRAWEGFRSRADGQARQALEHFDQIHRYWLEDYLLFQAISEEQMCGWWDWPKPLRRRQAGALLEARTRLQARLEVLHFEQFLFFQQWYALREYAHTRGLRLFGDMPIFVAQDSAEVWARPQDFDLLANGQPRVVAGVPPDYFSATGQRWGNPLYRWDRMAADGFSFWVERIKTQLSLFDLIRIDHFRGFEAYWEIPANETNAIRGRWVEGPGKPLFDQLHDVFGHCLPLVAEDLGIITPGVEALRRHLMIPGMRVLQFAFSGDVDNPYLSYNHTPDSVVYTGTHDNDTTWAWWHDLDNPAKDRIQRFLGYPGEALPWALIRSALRSVARLAVIPMQDLLELGHGHRMNHPGTLGHHNWHWRFRWEMVDSSLPQRLREMIRSYGRLP